MKNRGFTLTELLVVIMIIGVLSFIAVPQYIRLVENRRAELAAAALYSIANASKMAYIDRNRWANGWLTNACNAGACNYLADSTNACDLVRCKYLASRDFDSMGYDIVVSNPGPGTCLGFSPQGGDNIIGCVKRKIGAYAAYGYAAGESTRIYAHGGAPEFSP